MITDRRRFKRARSSLKNPNYLDKNYSLLHPCVTASSPAYNSGNIGVEPKIKIKKKKQNSTKKNQITIINNCSLQSIETTAKTTTSKEKEYQPEVQEDDREDDTNKHVFDMIEKVQSNGFDDQRYKQPYSIPSGSSVSTFF